MTQKLRLLCLCALFALAPISFALEVLRFNMKHDRLEVRHYRGGKYATWVRQRTGANFVAVAGFYGYLTVNGQKLRCGVDYTVENGKTTIPSLGRDRRVLVAYDNGKVRIAPNCQTCLKWGKPIWAVAGMTTPPDPQRSLPRQFWAIKGDNFYRIKMKGTSRDCLRVAKQWGFEGIVHMDGGISLAPKILHPSYVLVYRNSYPKAILASSSKHH